MHRNARAFTLIELSIAMFVMLMVLALAIPSLAGVLRDRRLRRSLDDMNRLVQVAQERSVTERRPYLISWEKKSIVVRPESFQQGEQREATTTLRLRNGDAFLLNLPAALADDPPPDWAFWPSGTCEPAVVSYKGADGSWSARYSPLTGRAELATYATR